VISIVLSRHRREDHHAIGPYWGDFGVRNGGWNARVQGDGHEKKREIREPRHISMKMFHFFSFGQRKPRQPLLKKHQELPITKIHMGFLHEGYIASPQSTSKLKEVAS
jgi:hypothetical protein